MALQLIGRVLDNRKIVGYRVRREDGEQMLIGLNEAIRLAQDKQIVGVMVDRDGTKLVGINFKISALPSERKDPDKGKKPTLQSKRSKEERYNRIIGAAADDGTMKGILQGCRNMILLNMPDKFKRGNCEKSDVVEETRIESKVSGNIYNFVTYRMAGTMNRLTPIGESWNIKLFVQRPGEKDKLIKEVLVREHDCKDNDCVMSVKERIVVIMDVYEVAKKLMKEIEERERGLNRLG